MRIVIQRVSRASVTVDNVVTGQIGNGLLVLVGIEDADTNEDIEWTSKKIVNLRIFDDGNKIPNLSVKEISGDILVVSQFTLQAPVKQGNRPSSLKSSKAATAIPIYEKFLSELSSELGKQIFTGVFGADMKVELVNDGPITIVIDSKCKE